jgi:hypothetical protein
MGRRYDRSRLSADAERPPDLEKRLQYTYALVRLTAEDAEADKILAEVRSLLKPASALREPELASQVIAMMAPAQAFITAGITLLDHSFSREN